MKKDKIISLCGTWKMEYLSPEAYVSEEEAKITDAAITVENAVPAYFEDLTDIFATATFADKIAINPMYEHQAYPMTEYPPDMALPNPVGSFVYTRTFELSELSDNAYLYFGGAQNRVYAWINGKFVGSHEGYSAEFDFKINDGVLKIGENRITLAVSNVRLLGYMDRPVSGLTSRAANECTGGIYGDVKIRFTESGVRDVWVSTSPDLSAFTVNTVGDADRERTLAIYDGEKELTRVKIPGGEASATLSADGYALWSPDSPKLYEAKIFDSEGNIFTRKFGIRRLTVRGTKLYLNGEPYFFRGICEHCYHPITVHPTREKKYYEKVIKTAKELGFNSIRFHTYVPPMEYMEAADELGILIEVETPNNTSYAEWCEIVKMSRRYTSVIAYSSGNEMVIDEDYIEHLRAVAKFVHTETDSLFSPMSAMRGVEYSSYGDCQVEIPFTHNPKRLAALGEFCDIYNSYSLGTVSYRSLGGDYKIIDERNSIYKKPLLTHEICINGTYCDLSLKDRYEGSRIGKTELFTSVERHLADVGILDRADLYYKNSVAWQKLLRKSCFELVRRCDSFAGYDFLGDIDTHWHTFGYCVGMMNEFYELKPGETVENVKRYNSDAVLLSDLPKPVNFKSGDAIEIPILVSNYGKTIENATLKISLLENGKSIFEKEIKDISAEAGEIKQLYVLKTKLPEVLSPAKIILSATLTKKEQIAENLWDLYLFPAPAKKTENYPITIASKMTEDELCSRLKNGERVVIFGSEPFQSEDASFQISLAGRTNGHLATVINKHPLTERLAHDGFLGAQFEELMTGAKAIILNSDEVLFNPIIEVATAYKNAHKEAFLFEYAVGDGKLIVCSLNLENGNPLSLWLKREIENYAAGDSFKPEISVTENQLLEILGALVKKSEANTNLAFNKNDVTAN